MSLPEPVIRGCRSRDEVLAVVDLCARAFEKTPRSYFERHVLRDPTLRLEDTLILESGGAFLSSVQIFPRMMQVGTMSVPCGGIGNVATDPAARRSGFASLVMLRAMEVIRQRGWPLALLSTTINAYYEKFGFRTVVRDCLQVRNVPLVPHEDVRPFVRETDLAPIRALYDEYNAGAIGPFRRDRDYWEAQFAFCDEDPEMFLVIGDPGSPCAYIRGAVQKGLLQVMEFAARGDVPGLFERLVSALAARAPGVPVRVFLSRRERERVALRFPHDVVRDTEMMIAVHGEPWQTRMDGPVIEGGEFQFWRTDFF